MRRHPAKRHQYRKKISLPFKRFFIAALIISALITVVLTVNNLLIIKEIKCESQYGPCSAFIQSTLDEAKGKNYFLAKRDIKAKFEKNVMVTKYSVLFTSANQIKVTVVERKAIGALARQDKLDEVFAIDSEGYIVSVADSSNLPILIIKQDMQFSVGEQTPEEVRFGIKILREIANTYTVKVAYMETDGIVVPLSNGLTAIFPRRGDVEVLMGSLSLILSRLNTDKHGLTINESGLVPKIIDLRFKNPVLR